MMNGTSSAPSRPPPPNCQPRDWYEGSQDSVTGGRHTFDVYAAAKAKLLSELTLKEYEQIVCEAGTSPDSLIDLLSHAKSKYENQPTCKARKWLDIFAGKVVYYGTVLDVMVQQYPQYVSLAWGAMKFLFMSVINHEEMTKELAKAYSMIADLLPRTDFTLIHYPTDAMKEAISQLYAQIILFTSRAIRWYKKGKFSHAVSAVARPWALNWKDSVNDITEQSRRVESLARVAAQAELRDTRLEVKGLRSEVKIMAAASSEAHSAITRLLECLSLSGEQIYSITSQTQTLVRNIQPRLDTLGTEISQLCLSRVVVLPWAKNIPSPESTLDFCVSLKRRRKSPNLQLPQLETLKIWATSKQSTLLLITGISTQASNNLTIDLAKLLCASNAPTIWLFRYPSFWEPRPCFTSILRNLTLQIMHLFPKCLTSGNNPLTSVQLQEASTDDDWMSIMAYALSDVDQLYILLDVKILSLAGDHNKYRITRWLEKLMTEIGKSTSVKMFVSGMMIDRSYIEREWDAGSWSELRTDYVESSYKAAKSRSTIQHRVVRGKRQPWVRGR
ncbi:hypothetical protein L207DRAFT_487928 [Hyaloscypha variabilis F]|uniref:DUF7708 domain-containing protein n=1 Tax=Hyaloscypha variabilis (strain UAMH 11265 / GT02V1 / F) TaxID=1149755 RepID=A0A2J6RNY8_HYAVF|nr:hypothetical protein L207DRAFT_487928 [Hyaloscypha variabilis F]